MSRAYDMSQRSQAALMTRDGILQATELLLTEGAVAGVTLKAIAEQAGITVQTVLRHMGSREGCFDALAARFMERVQDQRGNSKAGDVKAALSGLMAHYEAEGRLVLSLLGQENTSELAHRMAHEGRAYHRRWVEHSFGPHISLEDRTATVDALVAATDLYVWKLLRLDLGRSAKATQKVVHHTVRALLDDH